MRHLAKQRDASFFVLFFKTCQYGVLTFDPFAGSFTTGAVAKRLGRNSISIDIEPEFYKIGLRRLDIATTYKGELLTKKKERKTHNQSKKSRAEKDKGKENETKQLSLM